MTTELFDTDDEEFRQSMIGRRIVAVDTERHKLWLDDGTIVEFTYMQDCCAWFTPMETRHGELVDNIITDVQHPWRKVSDIEGDSRRSYRVVFMHENQELASVRMSGDITSGYYMEVGTVYVTKPEKPRHPIQEFMSALGRRWRSL